MRGFNFVAALACVALMAVGGSAFGKESASTKGAKAPSSSALPDYGMAIRVGLGPKKAVLAELMMDSATFQLMERSIEKIPELGDMQHIGFISPKFQSNKVYFTLGPAQAACTLEQVRDWTKNWINPGGTRPTSMFRPMELTSDAGDSTPGWWFQFTGSEGETVAGWGTTVEGQWVRVWSQGEKGKPDNLPITIMAAETWMKCLHFEPAKDAKKAEGLFVTRKFEGGRLNFTLPTSWTDRGNYLGGTVFEGQRMELTPAEQSAGVKGPARWIAVEPLKLLKNGAKIKDLVQEEIERLNKESQTFEILRDPKTKTEATFSKVGKLEVAYINLSITGGTEKYPARRMICIDGSAVFRLTMFCQSGTSLDALKEKDAETKAIFDSVTVGN